MILTFYKPAYIIKCNKLYQPELYRERDTEIYCKDLAEKIVGTGQAS